GGTFGCHETKKRFQRGCASPKAGYTWSWRRALPCTRRASTQRSETEVPISAVPTRRSRKVGANFGLPNCSWRTNWTCWPAAGAVSFGPEHTCRVSPDTVETVPSRYAGFKEVQALSNPPT